MVRDYVTGLLGGVLIGAMLVYAAILAMSRHVNYGFESDYLAMHDRWDAKGVKPGQMVSDADPPPPATDW